MSITMQGFEEVGYEEVRDIIVSLEGDEKTGKTTFALTSPSPIALFRTDRKSRTVVNKAIDAGKTIIRYNMMEAASELDMSEEEPTIDARNEYIQFKLAYYAVLSNPDVRSVIIDNFTDIWELARLAAFGRTSQVKTRWYGPINTDFRKMIKAAEGTGKILFLIHKRKDEYLNDQRTGNRIRSGFGEVGFLANTNVVTSFDIKSKEFSVFIRDCGENGMLAGETFSGPLCNFPILASAIFPKTSPSDWE